MASVAEIQNLRREVDSLKERIAKNKGVKEQLEKESDGRSLEELESDLKKLERERVDLERQRDEQYTKFRKMLDAGLEWSSEKDG